MKSYNKGVEASESTNSSFLFSLSNNHKFLTDYLNYTIAHHSDYGPIFGGGHYLLIHIQFKDNNASFANIGKSYTNEKYQFDQK